MTVAIHHILINAMIWDDPHMSNLDRWTTAKVNDRPKGSHAPFAAGPRMCIGFNFAVQEVRVVLRELVYNYEFAREGNEKVEYDSGFQLIRPMNLFVRAKRGTTWPNKLEEKDARK